MDKSIIEEKLDTDIDALYLEFGKHLYPDSRSFGDLGDDKLKQIAKAWFREHQAILREKICDNKTVIKLQKKARNEDRILLVAAIADILMDLYSNIPLFTVAVLITKEVLETLCSNKE